MPWLSIISSPAVWAIIIVHGCSVFGYFLVVNQLPGYMKKVLHYDIKANGLLSSLPYLGKYVMSIIASIFADHLRSTGKITTTVARKAFTGFAVAPPGFMFILLIFFGYDKIWSITIFVIALTFNGAVTAGYLGNGLDIAPNFSGTIFGMANTLSSFGGWVSTFMVGALTDGVAVSYCLIDELLIFHIKIYFFNFNRKVICMENGRLSLELLHFHICSVLRYLFCLAEANFNHGIIHQKRMEFKCKI